MGTAFGCGKGGIRTLGTGFARTNAFQAFQLNHSCTFPGGRIYANRRDKDNTLLVT